MMQRRRFSNLISILLMLPLPVAAQVGATTVPAALSIEQFLVRNVPDAPSTKQFVFLRCAALYTFFGGVIGAQGDAKSEAAYNQAGFRFLSMAAELEPQKEVAGVVDQMRRMVVMYSDRAKDTKARTGSISDDPLIKSDAEVCKKIAR